MLVTVVVVACATVGPARYPDGVAPGTDAQHPLRACGGVAGSHLVATSTRCRDGSTPLHGDPRRALDGRVGVTDGPDGHDVQMYDVPCPGGMVRVYVDETCPLPARVFSAVKYRVTGNP